mgnify:CR=1 FL=1
MVILYTFLVDAIFNHLPRGDRGNLHGKLMHLSEHGFQQHQVYRLPGRGKKVSISAYAGNNMLAPKRKVTFQFRRVGLSIQVMFFEDFT